MRKCTQGWLFTWQQRFPKPDAFPQAGWAILTARQEQSGCGCLSSQFSKRKSSWRKENRNLQDWKADFGVQVEEVLTRLSWSLFSWLLVLRTGESISIPPALWEPPEPVAAAQRPARPLSSQENPGALQWPELPQLLTRVLFPCFTSPVQNFNGKTCYFYRFWHCWWMESLTGVKRLLFSWDCSLAFKLACPAFR